MTIRKNVTMAKSTAEWYEQKSKEMGVPQSSLMSIALNEYIKNDKALNLITEMLQETKKTRFEWTKEDEDNWNEQIAEKKRKEKKIKDIRD